MIKKLFKKKSVKVLIFISFFFIGVSLRYYYSCRNWTFAIYTSPRIEESYFEKQLNKVIQDRKKIQQSNIVILFDDDQQTNVFYLDEEITSFPSRSLYPKVKLDIEKPKQLTEYIDFIKSKFFAKRFILVMLGNFNKDIFSTLKKEVYIDKTIIINEGEDLSSTLQKISIQQYWSKDGRK